MTEAIIALTFCVLFSTIAIVVQLLRVVFRLDMIIDRLNKESVANARQRLGM